MNAPFASHPAAAEKSGIDAAIGRSVKRTEDPILVQGQGRYTDDLSLAGQLHAVVVRSQYAHGIINAIETEDARAMPGVVAIYTGADLAHYTPLKSPLPLKGRDGKGLHGNARPIFPTDKVRFVGDPVALVVAETAQQARDAAEAVVLDIDALPAVTDGRDAIAEGAPQLYDDVPRNICLDFHDGDTAALDAAFARAAHVTHLELVSNRIVVSAMEPRAAIADYDFDDDRYVMHVESQGVFGMRAGLAQALNVAPEKVRVLTGHVGGSFGMKASIYPEYIALLHAARALKRPVKWTDSRAESFVSDHQGRDHVIEASLALDEGGRFLAVRMNVVANMGGYLSPWPAFIATQNLIRNAVSVYRTPLFEIASICCFTNTVPIAAYRGAGRPEGNYVMERLIEAAARETGRDAVALRKLNHIRPEQIPYKSPVGTIYDSGDFTGLLDDALNAADWDGYEARRRDSESRGKLRGRGIGQYLEITAQATNEMGGIRFEENGDVTIITGTLDYGQGHATPFAQVLVSQLGIPFGRVRLKQSDSDELIAGGGTGGSKSIMASGTAIVEASAKVIDAGRLAASYVLEAAPADIEFANGRFSIAGTDRGIDLLDLAAKLREGGLPPDCPKTLNVSHVHKLSASTYPNGCHIAEVEVDPQTGHVQVVRYTMANDFGTVVNPMIVAGQAHGGVLQGIGQALMERTVVDESGQVLTGSYMDYAVPRAEDAPPFAPAVNHPTKATTNPLGVKGCGEAGCAGALPSVMNALVDALAPLGVRHVNMPATPETVWRLANGVT